MMPPSTRHSDGLNNEEGPVPQSFSLLGDIHHKLSHLLGKHRIGLAAIAGVGLLASIFWTVPKSMSAAPDPTCQTWDQSASHAVARLVGDPGAEAVLADAVFRLKRARNNCRNGFVNLARQDYYALIDGRYGRRQ
jgi:hypothetical protein